ncbi:kinase-like protein [Limtongia smithiae]|uniref:kinase-like protein n=1 Tax=Limtongia smithiae TaxID=1125753 RepID=UPI0034CECADD
MGNIPTKETAGTADDDLCLQRFRMLRVVGRGSFSRVRIVQDRVTNKRFAMKYFRKDQVVKSDCVSNILRERKILEVLRHPFICNLRYCFQDDDYLYLLVDLKTGGDLRFHLRRRSFAEPAVKFWIAEVACALDYVHARGYVHRDIKPENILLDADGHVSLADFNVATSVSRRRKHHSAVASGATRSEIRGVSGTMAYVAPEVYTAPDNDAYGPAVDWWALGVVMYECIYGHRPFVASDQEELISRITTMTVLYPPSRKYMSIFSKSAMQALLSRNPEERLGVKSIDDFFEHPFFSTYTKAELEAKKFKPPFVPSNDKINYDTSYDLEELLLEDSFEYHRGKQSKWYDFVRGTGDSHKRSNLEEKYSLIQNLFEAYDYTKAGPLEYPTSSASSSSGSVHGDTHSTPASNQHHRHTKRSSLISDIGSTLSDPPLLTGERLSSESLLLSEHSASSARQSSSRSSDSPSLGSASPCSLNLGGSPQTPEIARLHSILLSRTAAIPQHYVIPTKKERAPVAALPATPLDAADLYSSKTSGDSFPLSTRSTSSSGRHDVVSVDKVPLSVS